MFTEFYRVDYDSRQDMSLVNARVHKIREAGANNVEVDRQREGESLYVTITYDLNPGVNPVPFNEAS